MYRLCPICKIVIWNWPTAVRTRRTWRTSQKPGGPVKIQAYWSCWIVKKKIKGKPCIPLTKHWTVDIFYKRCFITDYMYITISNSITWFAKTFKRCVVIYCQQSFNLFLFFYIIISKDEQNNKCISMHGVPFLLYMYIINFIVNTAHVHVHIYIYTVHSKINTCKQSHGYGCVLRPCTRSN